MIIVESDGDFMEVVRLYLFPLFSRSSFFNLSRDFFSVTLFFSLLAAVWYSAFYQPRHLSYYRGCSNRLRFDSDIRR